MSRRIVLIAAAAAIGIAALWFVLLWRPQSSKLDAAAMRKVEAENTNGELTLRVSELEDLERRKPQLEAQREALQAAVPGTADLGEFLLQVDEVAEQAGVNFSSIAPTPPAVSESGAPPTAVTLNISVDGGYFEVLDYLNRLDKLPRLVVTDTLTLNGAEDSDTGEQRVSATIAARMFTTEPPPTADGTVAPGAASTTTAPGGASETTTTTAGG